MLIVHVHVHVKPESAEAFRAATMENARASVREPGVIRFDVIRQQDDPARFVLVEIYREREDSGDFRYVLLATATATGNRLFRFSSKDRGLVYAVLVRELIAPPL